MDINQEGNAYTVISWEYPTPLVEEKISRLESILRYGLLGTAFTQREGNFGVKINKADYDRLLAEGNKMSVFFHIVGRLENDDPYSRNVGEPPARIDENHALFNGNLTQVGVLFNLSTFRENYSPNKFRGKEDSMRDDGINGVYQPYHDWNEVRGKNYVDEDYGFVISPMIPREQFTGIIFKSSQPLTPSEYEKRIEELVIETKASRLKINRLYLSGFPFKPAYNEEELTPQKIKEELLRCREYKYSQEESNPEKLAHRAKEIAEEQLKANGNQSDLLVPIYDIHGNMWWPERISYDQLRAKE